MNKISIIVAGVVVLVVAGFFIFRTSPGEPEPVVIGESVDSLPVETVGGDNDQDMTNGVNESTTEAQVDTTDNSYSLEEVSEHDNIDDCWLVLDGKVYDVTGFVSSHPGGKAILEGCGKDATEFFETRPMGSGTAHSERARRLRENYFIGDLIE